MARRPRRTLKDRWRDTINGRRFHCDDCNRSFGGYRAMNAHHLARHASRWTSAKARKTARDMGKAWDAARKHARGWREAAGLTDPRGNRTAKGRARPEARTRTRLRDLRQMHRHDRDADRTDQRAGRLERRAGRSTARADHHASRADAAKTRGHATRAARRQARSARHQERAATHRNRVADERMAHHQRWPERTRT